MTSLSRGDCHPSTPRSAPRRHYTFISSTSTTPWIPTSTLGGLGDWDTSSYCCPLLKVRHRRLQAMARSTTGAILETKQQTTLLAGMTLLVVKMEAKSAGPSAPPLEAPLALRVTPVFYLLWAPLFHVSNNSTVREIACQIPYNN